MIIHFFFSINFNEKNNSSSIFSEVYIEIAGKEREISFGNIWNSSKWDIFRISPIEITIGATAAALAEDIS